MKLLWTLWALAALLTGCRGEDAKTSSEEQVTEPELWNSEPAQAWEIAMGRFRGYLDRLQTRVEDLQSEVQSFQIVKDLRGLMTDTLTELNAYKAELDQELTPVTEETRNKLTKELTAAQARLRADMEDVGSRLAQYHREFHTVVNHNIDEVRNRISAYLRKMKKRIGRDYEELQTRMDTYQAGAKEGVERGLGSLKHLAPLLERVQEQNKKRMASLGTLAGEHLQSHLDQVRSRMEEVKTKVDEQSAQLQAQLQGFHDRLKAWFQPLTTDLQRQWTLLVDKVQEAINPNGKLGDAPDTPLSDN
ncbi:apolipoprotein E [Phascolarctos cinereus]|uniref:Apolipoprotein E n=1 Tax=Phascolarctos cinereus TaxID=38626 RepID=A0A6P5LLJ8_PHACI|nr:apolipoprotein E [Phascolarctos cinereus]XP_020859276.1 apolipoprotein E [Phascolarctos cinereus]